MAASGSQNSTTPFFGCKISLISKSEIRYEGILYTIDPKESTIALAKVRSYGSEDRPVERPVPPRDDIFEFIIFRASDIKDLIVDDPPPAPQLTDPAIIQAQHSTSTSFPSSFPQGSISQPSAGSGPAPIVASAGAPQQVKPIQQLQPQQAQSQPKGQRGQQQQQSQQQQANESSTDGQNVVKLSKPAASNVAGAPGYSKVAGGGSSAPSTQQQPKLPSSNQRNQQNLQFNNKQQQQGKSDGQQQQSGAVPRLSQQQGPGQQQNLSQAGPQNGYSNRRQQNNRDGLQSQNRVLGEGQNPNYHARNGQQSGQQQQGGFRPFNQRFGQGRGGFNQSGTSSGGGQQNFSGGFNRRGGPGGFSGPRNFSSNRPTGLSAHPNGPKFAPLPDGDFDFEKAQADFKILEEKLHALRLNGSAAAAPGGDAGPDAAGGADSTDVIVPGIPLSAISVAALEQQDQEIANKEVCYNKTKSFFDSISCEALEREKGSVQRVDWKQERKMNRETFGVVSARRPTFFRMNNRGGGFGGGYHHNHRGGYRSAGGDRGGDRGDGQDRRSGPGGHFQNRSYQQNRGPRTPTSGGSGGGGQSQSQNISSTTNGGGQSRTPAKASNGVGASPVVAPLIATKN